MQRCPQASIRRASRCIELQTHCGLIDTVGHTCTQSVQSSAVARPWLQDHCHCAVGRVFAAFGIEAMPKGIGGQTSRSEKRAIGGTNVAAHFFTQPAAF